MSTEIRYLITLHRIASHHIIFGLDQIISLKVAKEKKTPDQIVKKIQKSEMNKSRHLVPIGLSTK